MHARAAPHLQFEVRLVVELHEDPRLAKDRKVSMKPEVPLQRDRYVVCAPSAYWILIEAKRKCNAVVDAWNEAVEQDRDTATHAEPGALVKVAIEDDDHLGLEFEIVVDVLTWVRDAVSVRCRIAGQSEPAKVEHYRSEQHAPASEGSDPVSGTERTRLSNIVEHHPESEATNGRSVKAQNAIGSAATGNF